MPLQAWGVVSPEPAMVHNLPSDADERAGYPIVFGKGQVHCCAKGPVRRGQALFARLGDDDGRLVAADEMPPSEGARVGLALAGGTGTDTKNGVTGALLLERVGRCALELTCRTPDGFWPSFQVLLFRGRNALQENTLVSLRQWIHTERRALGDDSLSVSRCGRALQHGAGAGVARCAITSRAGLGQCASGERRHNLRWCAPDPVPVPSAQN